MGVWLTGLKLIRAARTGRLRKLDICVTHKCNMRCKTCSVWLEDGEVGTGGELTVENFEDFFRKHPDWMWIGFTGGEPFQRNDFEKIVEAAASHCPELLLVSVATNGSAPDRTVEFARWFSKTYPRILLQLSVSIDGEEQLHDKIRGKSGTFAAADRTYKLLQDMKSDLPMFRVTVSYTISALNAGNLSGFSSITGLKTEEMQVAPAAISYRYRHTGKEAIVPPDSSLQRDFRWLLESLPRRPGNALNLMFARAYLERLNVPCLAGRGSFHMEPDGGIYPCILLDEKIADHSTFETGTQFEPSAGCMCYTPCETYPAFLAAPKRLLARLLFFQA